VTVYLAKCVFGSCYASVTSLWAEFSGESVLVVADVASGRWRQLDHYWMSLMARS
jgi:hypothetical protein